MLSLFGLAIPFESLSEYRRHRYQFLNLLDHAAIPLKMPKLIIFLMSFFSIINVLKIMRVKVEKMQNTVEHTYDTCPKYSELGSFRIIRKKYSVFIYSEAEPHAMYAIHKETCTLCVLQYGFVLAIFCFALWTRGNTRYSTSQ